jgi:hypothetical protein
VKPDAHSRQSAIKHVAGVEPAVVLQIPPFMIRATQVPAPLQ